MRTAVTLAALAIATASPALAVDTAVSFNLANVKGTTGKAVTGGYTFSAVAKDGTKINLRASAWTATYDSKTKSYITSSATLGFWDGGLGVTAASPKDDKNGANNTHQIDNVKSVDFVLLQFDKAVDLAGISKNVYGLNDYAGKASWDSDASFAFADTNSSWNSAYNLAGLAFPNSSLPTELSESATHKAKYFDTDTIVNTGYHNLWAIGAAFTPTGNDGFKLAGLTASYNRVVPPSGAGPVPEPATWAMMIMGFGLVGATARRSRRTPATVAA